jgi:hypothetical protein
LQNLQESFPFLLTIEPRAYVSLFQGEEKKATKDDSALILDLRIVSNTYHKIWDVLIGSERENAGSRIVGKMSGPTVIFLTLDASRV